MLCRGRQFISAEAGSLSFDLPWALPLPNLGFSLVGFAALHLAVAGKLVSVAPWGFLSTRDIRPPLRAPAYLGLFLPLAQSLHPSQDVRAWTFLYHSRWQQSSGSEFSLFDLGGIDTARIEELF
jgi:hypothetical protein